MLRLGLGQNERYREMNRFCKKAVIVGAVLFATGFGAAPAFAATIPLEPTTDTADNHSEVQPIIGDITQIDSQSAGSTFLGCLINKVPTR